MSEFSNPYRPGELVTDPAMLFGRQNVADWIELHVSGGNRTMLLSAMPLAGKTSFLRHAGHLLNAPMLHVQVSLGNLPSTPAAESEQTLNSVLDGVTDQLLPQFALLNLISADYKPAVPQAASALRELFAQITPALPDDRPLLLYFDDLHRLIAADRALAAGFLTGLMPLLDECPALRLVFAANQESLKQLRHPLLDGAPVYNLGVLPTDASLNMITEPVKDTLRFDYGVTKRISEVCSHHPYYLSLYCHALLNRQMHDGWVNQQDFDTVLNEVLAAPVEPFIQIWDESSWAERAVLAGMSAIQGAHGPITGQEIIRNLQRQDSGVDAGVVQNALNTLAERGVLVPMGAVSYRFHVEMLRFWLRAHTVPEEIIGQVNWGRAAGQLKQSAAAAPAAGATASHRAPQTPRRKSRGRFWLGVMVILLLACAVVAAGGVLAARVFGVPIAFLTTPTPTPTPTATPKAQADAAPLESAPAAEDSTPELPAEPTPTPSPTPALVVARSLPSITYMGRDVDQNWQIFVMDADGANPLALTPVEEGDDTSPVWSPDGQKIAFVSRRDGNREIYVMDAAGQNAVNVTRHPADDWTPAWSPDGSTLAFSSFRDGSWEIYLMDTTCFAEPASCVNALTPLTSDGNGNLSPVWSPDGTRFAFNSKANGNWDIFTMAVDGTDVRQITTAPENDLAPIWSPDGTELAFESNRDGNVEVYVIGAEGGAARNISNQSQADDHGPTWSPDGQQLVFYSNREGNWDIFTVPAAGGNAVNLTNTPSRDEQTPAWRP